MCMMHVVQIENLIEEDKTAEAEDALESLLSLGPHNIAALKLMARLCEFKGKFDDEADYWKKVYQIDSDDADAITFFQLRNLEDQEHHYFTDVSEDGSQRLVTYQRQLLKPMFFGFLGSLVFVLLAHLAETRVPIFLNAKVLLPLFFLTTLLPMVWLLVRFFTGMWFLSLSEDKFSITTRVKTYEIRWDDVATVELVHSGAVEDASLSLIILPENQENLGFEIDLGRTTSCLRSRHIFVKEVALHFRQPVLAHRDNASAGKNLIKF